jgi:hypothetical protein
MLLQRRSADHAQKIAAMKVAKMLALALKSALDWMTDGKHVGWSNTLVRDDNNTVIVDEELYVVQVGYWISILQLLPLLFLEGKLIVACQFSFMVDR